MTDKYDKNKAHIIKYRNNNLKNIVYDLNSNFFYII